MENAMSELSRRSIVTGAAVLPALAVHAVVLSAAASPHGATIGTAPDPIFAAIEQYRKAWEDTLGSAVHEHSEAEKQWRDENGAIRPSLLLCTREKWETNAEAYFKERNEPPMLWPFGEHKEIRFYSGNGIDQFCRDNREHRSLLRGRLAAIKRKHRTIFGPIEARVAAAHEAVNAARWQLATTAPTTAAGVSALLRYVREQEEGNLGEFFDDDEQVQFHASLCDAVMALESGAASQVQS
jgi:hypothetical protein